MGVFAKYGFKEGITSAPNLRKALEELGPTFVKIAQILSTRPDILSQPYIEEFQKLQDDVKPEPYSVIREIIQAQLGKNPEQVFSQFNSQPMASASIAQVHRARLLDGTNVAVKVKRPGIEEKITNDLKLLKQMSRMIQFLPQTSVWNPAEVVDELSESLELELNFLHEAENIRKFQANHQGTKYITIPALYPDYSTRDIIVLEYIDGIKVSDTVALEKAGYDLEEITAKIIYNFMNQVFEHGIFHADLHPGNILISANKIVFLDFGLVGTMNETLKANFNKLLMGIVEGDLDMIISSIVRIGIKKGKLDRARLRSEIEHLYNDNISASIYDIDIPQLMEEIFRICRQNKIAFPRDITLLIKGILVLEGVVNRLSPGMAVIDMLAPFIRSQIMNSRNVKQELLRYAGGLHRMTRSSLRIPDRVLEILNKVAAGTATVQLETLHLKDVMGDLKRSLNRIVFALIVSSLIIGSSLVIATDAGPKVLNISLLGLAGYLAAAVMGLWLLISILHSGKI